MEVNSKDDSVNCAVIWESEVLYLINPDSAMHEDDINNLLKLFKYYIKKLHEKLAKQPPILKPKVYTYPGLLSSDDYWIYLLREMKNYYLNLPSNSDFYSVKHKEIIQRELYSNKIFYQPRRKRSKPEGTNEDLPPKKTRFSVVHRVFLNEDAESCWLNSCLQVLLSLFDHDENLPSTGSTFYELLLWLWNNPSNEPLDPISIRDLLYATEKQRIVLKNIPPANRLFHYFGTQSYSVEELEMEQNARGQQDCKDFFICIEESKNYWLDIYGLFEFSLKYSTLCSSCQQVSESANSITTQSMLILQCPNEDVILSEYVFESLSMPITVNEWRHENGCNMVTNGLNFKKLANVQMMKYLVVVVERLLLIDGQLTISPTRINPIGNVNLIDVNGNNASFEPIGIIHHTGRVTSAQDTRGHYMADVLNKQSGEWIRTSDDAKPKHINEPTCNGYIFVFKKNS